MNSNPSQTSKTEPTRLQVAGGIAAIALFLWMIVYNVGKPWNCQQAQSMLEDARGAAKQAGADAQAYHISDVRDAYTKMQDKCSQ
jgi:hypothetical protein